jgi:uncharacterized membrane-anchored protein YhcB (DUF1043 family)
MSNYSNDNSKGWALGFGLLAGIAIGYYLNSNEGRAARRKAAVQFDEYGNQVSEYSHQVSERANTITDDTKAKYEEGKQWAGETADSLKSTLNEKATALKTTATETVSTVEESFKRGVEKAKTKANTTKA